ncbi:MAG: 7-cyano-7-deazaguanine synthase [Deferrisomatales bacterium]|nr:7-cyano-7-deazaguanine synthase [Deferrisomatales bacterium]
MVASDPSPSYHYAITPDGRISAQQSGAERELEHFYHVDDHSIAEAVSKVLPESLADLIDVAIGVYAADRLARRPAFVQTEVSGWRRRLHVSVPVRNPDLWRGESLGLALQEALLFITDDEWSFEFVPRYGTSRRRSEVQGHLFADRLPDDTMVSLFSGGLDSLVGLAGDVLDLRPSMLLLVCAQTNDRIRPVQQRLIREISKRKNQACRRVGVRFGFHRRAKGRYGRDERTQRTRAFSFLALGAVMARHVGLDSARVYENGVGAINLPYTDAQVGAQSSRASNPLALHLVEQVIGQATGRAFSFELPLGFTTKATACRRLADVGLADLVAQSISCDGFPQRISGRVQCGVCTSCVLRRQSLFQSGLAGQDPGEKYVYDLLDSNRLPPSKKLIELRAMQHQVKTQQFPAPYWRPQG